MLLAGWGVFNVVEGVIDHQILGIHHVRDDLGAPIGWDIGFLVFGVSRECLEHPEDQQQHDGDDRRDDQRSEAAEAVREKQEQGIAGLPERTIQ